MMHRLNIEMNLSSKTELFIRVSGNAANDMALEFKSGPMVRVTKDNGRATKLMEKASSGMLTVISSTVNGRMTKPMAMAFTLMSMEPSTKETGKMISNTAMASKHGQMDQSMKAIIRMARNMAKEPMSGVMGLVTSATGLIIRSTDPEFILGSMGVRIKARGKTIICTAMAPTRGATVVNTKENTTWTKSMGTASIIGLMVADTKDTGQTESNTEKGNISCRLVQRKLASGRKASAYAGSNRLIPVRTQWKIISIGCEYIYYR